MKIKFRRLALAAVLLSSSSMSLSSMALADQGGSVVGDLPGFGEEAYFGEDAAYTQTPAEVKSQQNIPVHVGEDSTASSQHVSDQAGIQPAAHTQHAPAPVAVASLPPDGSNPASDQQAHRYTPAAYRHMQPASYPTSSEPGHVHGGYVSHAPSGCGCGESHRGAEPSCGCGDAGCDGGASCGTHRRICSFIDRCQGNTWAKADVLLWFAQSRDTPPLIVQSDAGTLPVLDPAVSPSAVTVFGDQIESELTVGARVDAGIWLTDNVGIGGRFWGLLDSESSFAFSGNGNDQSIGRPFFNTNSSAFAGDNGEEDSLPIALTGVPGGPDLSGSVIAESSLDIWAAEAYARLRFGSIKGYQLDFIGGYSHFDIDDSLFIASTTTVEGTGAPPAPGQAVGDTSSFTDSFETANTFDGGQIGFDLSMNRGRWIAQSLTKVHLGNVNQVFRSQGRSVTTASGANLGGILAGNQDIDEERNEFAFAPEANFKLGYRFRPNVLLSVGYSFIYFDNVALTGDIIDRQVDGATLGQGTNTNGILDQDSSLFVQGIDLGFIIDF